MADRSFASRLATPQPTVRPLPEAGRQAVAVPGGFHHPLAPLPQSAPPSLLPMIGIDDELTPALERALEPVARRALAGDWAARDALHAAFEPKLMRFVRRIRVPLAPGGTTVGIWERDDVVQESYLVFVELVANWTPGIPFGRYVLANFPWRLRDAIHRGIGKRNLPPRSIGITPEEHALVADESATIAQQLALVEMVGDSLEPPLNAVFQLRLVNQCSLQEIAGRLGVSERSASRHWRTVQVRLRGLRH